MLSHSLSILIFYSFYILFIHLYLYISIFIIIFLLFIVNLWIEIISLFNNEKSNLSSLELISLLYSAYKTQKLWKLYFYCHDCQTRWKCSSIRDHSPIWDKKSNHSIVYYSTLYKIICKEFKNLFVKRYF